jgi:hypothetical protein
MRSRKSSPTTDNLAGKSDSGLRSVLLSWDPCGQVSIDPAPSALLSATQDQPSPVSEVGCFTQKTLAEFLAVSLRTIFRLQAQGLLPDPDIQINRSPRWHTTTIMKWLRSRPRIQMRRKS